MLAVVRCNRKIAQLLMDAGAGLDVKDNVCNSFTFTLINFGFNFNFIC